jgi:hypothetical protein
VTILLFIQNTKMFFTRIKDFILCNISFRKFFSGDFLFLYALKDEMILSRYTQAGILFKRLSKIDKMIR